jgi:hypothetical protein
MMDPGIAPLVSPDEAVGSAHEHVWEVRYVDYEEATVSTELACSCGSTTYR